MCILESLASRGCCSCPVEVQGPRGHHLTWMPDNIAPWVEASCPDAHWAQEHSEMMLDYAVGCYMGNTIQCCTLTKLPFRGSAHLLQSGYQPGWKIQISIRGCATAQSQAIMKVQHPQSTLLQHCWISSSSYPYMYPTLQLSIHPATSLDLYITWLSMVSPCQSHARRNLIAEVPRLQ